MREDQCVSIEKRYYDLLERHQRLIDEIERFLKKQSGYKELRTLMHEMRKTDPPPKCPARC